MDVYLRVMAWKNFDMIDTENAEHDGSSAIL